MRDLTGAMVTAITADTVRPAWIVEAEFENDTLRLWSGVGDLSWNAQTWTGVGDLGRISRIGDTSELRADGIQLELSGIPTNTISLALQEVRQSKTVKVWLALIDSAGAIIADPHESFNGLMDVPEIEEGAETSVVRITAESRLVALQRPNVRRYTNQDQQNEYPGDLGFEYAGAPSSRTPVQLGGIPDYKADLGFSID